MWKILILMVPLYKFFRLSVLNGYWVPTGNSTSKALTTTDTWQNTKKNSDNFFGYAVFYDIMHTIKSLIACLF